jgi:MerR family mercuric resistance operon transcriptional regulator
VKASDHTFTIGQLARAAGVPITTIRYYERANLLKPDARTGSNYRVYRTASLDRLQFIRNAQAAGLSLDDIASLIRLTYEHEAPCEGVQDILRQRLSEIDQRLQDLRSVKAAVETALDECRCAPRGGLCGQIDKFVNS